MSEVPEGEQGTAVRAIRGKQLHDQVVSMKQESQASFQQAPGVKHSKPFIFGTRKHVEPFSSTDFKGDDFEAKRKSRREQQKNAKGQIHSGPFFAGNGTKQPFQGDDHLYDHSRYDKGDCKLPECNDKLRGTRFSKTQNSKEPWRPNNPAKQGFNKTLNKTYYYHQTLFYRPKEEDKTREEKIWM